MSQTLGIPEIPVRIAQRAWSHDRQGRSDHSTFTQFVCDPENLRILFPDFSELDVSVERAHQLAKEVLSRFWSADRLCTAIISNISLNENDPLYLLRPAGEGAAGDGYRTDQGIPAYRCLIKNGFFLAIGFEVGNYPDEAGDDDLVLTAPAYTQIPPPPGEVLINKTRPPQPLPPDVLEAVLGLNSKRLMISQRLAEWRAFLHWHIDIIKERQIGLRYEID